MRRVGVFLVAIVLSVAHPAMAGVLIEPTRILGGPGAQIAGHRSLGLLA